MNRVASPRRVSLVAWLLACPILLAAAVFVLPQFKQLYGTPTEKFTLLAFVALPFIGVVGIVRRKQFALSTRLWLSAGYLVAGLVLALFAVIFIGCSWAGACF
jgi:membrane protease YdiL (CAAX protease family)